VSYSNKNHLASDPCNGGTVCLLRAYFYHIIHMCFALERPKHGVTAISLCPNLTSDITVLVKKVIEIDLTKKLPAFMLSKWSLHGSHYTAASVETSPRPHTLSSHLF